MNGREIKWPMVLTDSTNPILLDFDSLVANVATCVWKGVDWKSIANTGLLPNSRVRVVLGGHVQLSASKLKSNFFYRVGIKDSRVKKTGYLYLPFSAFNLPRGAIFNFNDVLACSVLWTADSRIQLRTWKLKLCGVVNSDMKRVGSSWSSGLLLVSFS